MKNDMDEIKEKLNELWELIKDVPMDCKGESESASKNRIKYLKLRRAIHNALEECKH